MSAHSANTPSRRRLGIGAVEERLGVSRQTIWRWCKTGEFPPPHYIGRDRAWYEDSLESWEQSRMAERAAEKNAAA